MKKGQIVEGIIESTDFPNKGIMITDEGEKVIVKGTIRGQRVKAGINKTRSNKAEGRLLEVTAKSPLESQKAACPHFPECGGCSYQEIAYEDQLAIKAEQVKKLLDAAAVSEYEFEGIQGSPRTLEYRNKMEFSFGDEYKGGPLSLGLHKKGSFYDVLCVNECRLVNEDYNRILTTVLDVCRQAGADYFHKITHKGFLRHLLVRRAEKSGDILAALVTAGPEVPSVLDEQQRAKLVSDIKEALAGLSLNGRISGILHIENSREADVVQADALKVLYGTEFLEEDVLGLSFRISTFSFFQTNSLGAAVLYSKVREYVGDTKDKVVFDLYSGTGTIGQILSPVAKRVVGIEIVEEAVAAAKENTARNGIDNAEFIAGDVLKKLDEITDKPDIIVLDPPRDGCNPKALEKIINYGVQSIVYVSCKPTSLARDLEMLQEKGYRLIKASCVDMFPQTPNVETIALLSRGIR